jgi:hypothetical protein
VKSFVFVFAFLVLLFALAAVASAQVAYLAPVPVAVQQQPVLIQQPAAVYTAPLNAIVPGYTMRAARGWTVAGPAGLQYETVTAQPMAAVGTALVSRRLGWRWLGPKPVSVAVPVQSMN